MGTGGYDPSLAYDSTAAGLLATSQPAREGEMPSIQPLDANAIEGALKTRFLNVVVRVGQNG